MTTRNGHSRCRGWLEPESGQPHCQYVLQRDYRSGERTLSPNPERTARDDVFVAEVLSSFGFLISDYGFRCVTATPTHVRYESKRVFVNVYRDPVSYEIEVEIGRRHLIRSAERGVTLGEIMDSLSVREKEGYTFIQASTSERVRKFVPLLAEWTKRYASETLSGRRSAFLRTLISRERRADHEWKQMELSSIRARADRAWHRKDYREVIGLYSAIAPSDLTASEAKKLEYAKKDYVDKCGLMKHKYAMAEMLWMESGTGCVKQNDYKRI